MPEPETIEMSLELALKNHDLFHGFDKKNFFKSFKIKKTTIF